MVDEKLQAQFESVPTQYLVRHPIAQGGRKGTMQALTASTCPGDDRRLALHD